jgi:hypothetical protein
MDDIRESIYVVGYWGNVGLVTTNKAVAENFCVRKRGESPVLPWAVRNVEDAILHAYSTGLADGKEEVEYYNDNI